MNDKRSLVIVLAVIALIAVAAVAVMALGGNNNSYQSNDMKMDHPKTKTTQKADEPAPAANAVTIQNYEFSPSKITVKVGTTVTWTNKDSIAHTVTSDEGVTDGPKSDFIEQGKSYSFTFTKAGTYTYHCTPHPYMKGTVTVTE